MRDMNAGIVGLGWAAGAHIEAFKHVQGAQVTAVCSRRRLDPAQLETTYGLPLTVYDDYDVLLQDETVDIVDICSPPGRHAEVDYYHGIGPWYGQFPWNVKKDGGGSSLLSAGCHAMDALLMVMDAAVEEVTSYATRSSSKTFAPHEYDTTSTSSTPRSSAPTSPAGARWPPTWWNRTT